MKEHPIENLMTTAMNSIRDMIDANTIVGNIITTEIGISIIPISKVCLGFAAGGTEFYPNSNTKNEESEILEYPFGGGSGAAIKINPIGFIIIDSNKENTPKFIPVEHTDAVDKLLDYVPDLIEKVNKTIEIIFGTQKETFVKENTNIQKEQIKKDDIDVDYDV